MVAVAVGCEGRVAETPDDASHDAGPDTAVEPPRDGAAPHDAGAPEGALDAPAVDVQDAAPDDATSGKVAWDDPSRYARCPYPLEADGPVVFRGERVPKLLGAAIGDITAFRWADQWVRVPLQVDERRWLDWPDPQLVYVVRHGWDGIFDHDDDPAFDADDEVAIPWEAFGEAPPDEAGRPPGTTGPGYVVRLPDAGGVVVVYGSGPAMAPLPWSDVEYVRRDCATDPDDPALPCGTPLGTASEDTWVRTRCYGAHFSMNWVLDDLHVTTEGGGDGTDLVDRWKGRGFTSGPEAPFDDTGEHEGHRDAAGTGLCGWSEVDGGHYYVGHTDGPVRAIRVIRGACSYGNTIRTWVFDRTRYTDEILLRGHSVAKWTGGLGFYWDYSSSAAPLVYRGEGLPGDVILDGVPDFPDPNVADIPLSKVENGYWEQVTSTHGSLVFFTRQTLAFSKGASSNTLVHYALDDAGHNDGTGNEAGVIGGHGIRFLTLQGTEQAPARLESVIRPAAANLPYVGEAFAESERQALEVVVEVVVEPE